jgi:hypothetical protein
MVFDYLQALREDTAGAQPFTVILQLHKIEKEFYVPTVSQVKSVSYLAMMEGAMGLLYYSTATAETPGWSLFDEPLWNDLPALIADLKRDQPIFLHSTVLVEKTAWPVVWQRRLMANTREQFICAVNCSAQPAKAVITLDNKNQTLTLAPWEVKLISSKKG